MELSEGKTLGRYVIEGEVGRGGMGVVYRGRQLSLNRPVAIKVLPPQLAADAQFRERFRQEAEIIAGLSHENILHVYDIEEADGTYFIVMELLEGASVRSIREARRLSRQEVYAVGIAVARALAYAHVRGIVHRDVKSQNVLITRDGRVKLADFGIARIAGGSVKTQTGAVLGTPEYMAPEQARSGEVTPQTDLYSLGVLLYELATGRLPFSGNDPFSVALKHVSEPPVPPRQVDPEVPEILEAIILRAMAKDPAERYVSAVQLGEDLERAAGFTPVSSAGAAAAVPGATPTPVTPPPTLLQAPTLVQGSTAALPPLPPLPPAAALPPPPVAPPASHTYATPRASASGVLRWVAGGLALVAILLAVLFLLRMRESAQRKADELAQLNRPPVTSTNGPAQPANDPGATSPASSSPPPPTFEKPVEHLGATPDSKPPAPVAAAPVTTAPAPRPAQPAPEPVRPAPAPARVEPEPEPAPTPARSLAETPADYRCRQAVEFHVSPEETDVILDGRRLGIADDWDGMGGGKKWTAKPGIYAACFQYPGIPRRCVTIAIDPDARNKECDVDLDLEDDE